MTDPVADRLRFEVSIIQPALWLYHRLPRSERDVQEVLHVRRIGVSHETLRQWNIPFAPLLTEALHYPEPRWGSLWLLMEGGVKVGALKHWVWRAVDEWGDVQGILLQQPRDAEAAPSFYPQQFSCRAEV